MFGYRYDVLLENGRFATRFEDDDLTMARSSDPFQYTPMILSKSPRHKSNTRKKANFPMKRTKLTSGPQTSTEIITGHELRVDHSTPRHERALSDPKYYKTNRRSLIEMLMSCAIMLAWLYYGFLRPLESEGREMVRDYGLSFV
jgi:hypothetical protein